MSAGAMRKRVAVLGASGYTGRELARLLARHPELELAAFLGARPGVAPEAPELPCDRPVEAFDASRLEGLDGAFLCTPHGTSAELARQCLERGLKVVDLSADFRLRDAALYERTYAHAHPAPELLGEAVYGLIEHARERVAKARLVANPGCYPTAVLLPLLPLLRAQLLDGEHTIVADCKSGTSGAGKAPSARTHFGSVHENFLAYAVGSHRHEPEIRQELGGARLVFTPHLLPVFRGILATVYVRPRRGLSAADLRQELTRAYRGERFVRVYERGLPELNRVQYTQECHMALADAGELVVLVACIDNLMRGAAGQALANMNCMLGLEEHAGL